MTEILIVDDEYPKAGMISDFLLSINKEINIVHATTSHDARLKVRDVAFDLILIDINLPASMGSTPNTLGGMDLFDMMMLDSASKLPLDILFITEKEDCLDQYNRESNTRGVLLCKFESSQDGWKKILAGKLKLTLARTKRNISINPTVDIAILTALGTPELDAVLRLPYNWQSKRFHDDPTGYHLGEKKRGEYNLKIVAASARRKGMPSSSALAMKMVERFKPRLIVMLGMCAGVKDKVNLGDVIVADPAWDWGSGKISQHENGSEVFEAAPHQCTLDHHLSQLANESGADESVLNFIRSGWNKAVPQGQFRVHVGPLASGAVVLASEPAILPITKQHRELFGIDMEAYAVMAASDYARKNAPISLVIKSVCDFADAKKSNEWQEYACYTSSAFFDRLLDNDFFPL